MNWILCLTFFPLLPLLALWYFLSSFDVQNVFYYEGYKFTCNLHSNKHQKQHPPHLSTPRKYIFFCFVSTLTECWQHFIKCFLLLHLYNNIDNIRKLQVKIYMNILRVSRTRKKRLTNMKINRQRKHFKNLFFFCVSSEYFSWVKKINFVIFCISRMSRGFLRFYQNKLPFP